MSSLRIANGTWEKQRAVLLLGSPFGLSSHSTMLTAGQPHVPNRQEFYSSTVVFLRCSQLRFFFFKGASWCNVMLWFYGLAPTGGARLPYDLLCPLAWSKA